MSWRYCSGIIVAGIIALYGIENLSTWGLIPAIFGITILVTQVGEGLRELK